MDSTDELVREIVEMEGEGGLPVSDMIPLADPLRDLLNWILRQKAFGLAALAEHLRESPERAQVVVDALLAKGHLQGEGGAGDPRYHVVLVSGRKRQMPGTLWDAIE